jgi:hypothetical protein
MDRSISSLICYSYMLWGEQRRREWMNGGRVGGWKREDLSGFPWLKAKLELTIMATQKAAKRRRKGQSRHLRSWRMTPPPGSWPSSAKAAAAAEG